MKKVFDALDIKTLKAQFDDRKKSDNSSKKSRRRSKAIKAKLTKIKSAELSKRLNLNGKKTESKVGKLHHKSDHNCRAVSKDDFKEINPIISSLQHLIDENSEVKCSNSEKTSELPKWQKHIIDMSSCNNFKKIAVDAEALKAAMNLIRSCAFTENISHCKLTESVDLIMSYLKELSQLICKKYTEHWENDRVGTAYISEFKKPSRFMKDLENKERESIDNFMKTFDNLVNSLKELASNDLKQFVKSLTKIESLILNYEIRGIKLQCYVCQVQTFTMQYNVNSGLSAQSVINHMQNVLNELEAPRNDLEIEIRDEIFDAPFTATYEVETPSELYYREMSLLKEPQARNKRKEIEAKLNTIANGFHLINSTMAICDDEDADKNQNKQKVYAVSDLNLTSHSKCSKPIHYYELSQAMPQRLKSQIASLKNSKRHQKILGGAIRISVKELRVNYIVSAGINFNAVELGLDVNNQPLAIKRTQRESWVGKIVKCLVEPLLGLMNNNVLHYFACEYEDNELILATPMCKWSVGQYVQILRQNIGNDMPGLTPMDIVKQFLRGLMALHKYESPIVHGNLKPSNIFVDFGGVVKVGEFGIHKALYKIIEAPKTSLIWFAKETLEIYQSSSLVECSLESDIQVAGTLIYFILMYGRHPFGEDVDEMIKNIQQNAPKFRTRNNELKDLLFWMTVANFSARPRIEQVLCHTFFWSTSKKWNFVLCCSGVNQSGYVLPLNVEKLYRSIDTFSDSHLKVQWQELIVEKLPMIRIKEPNNLVGLLKFIKYCHEHQLDVNLCDAELSNIILSFFPSLPTGLYRILQHTNWLKHSLFMPYDTIN